MEIKRRHILEYSLVLSLSLVFMLLFILFRTDHKLLTLLSGLVSSSYALWGIIHSALEGRLTRIVIIEYLLFGILVFLLLFIALSF
jgi:hypothetical protein